MPVSEHVLPSVLAALEERRIRGVREVRRDPAFQVDRRLQARPTQRLHSIYTG